MSWLWLVIGAVVLSALLGLTQHLRRLVLGFVLALVVLLALHFQTNPTEATAALATLTAGLAAARPLRRMVMGGLG